MALTDYPSEQDLDAQFAKVPESLELPTEEPPVVLTVPPVIEMVWPEGDGEADSQPLPTTFTEEGV